MTSNDKWVIKGDAGALKGNGDVLKGDIYLLKGDLQLKGRGAKKRFRCMKGDGK